MNKQDGFNQKVLEILRLLMEQVLPHAIYSEPRHEIVGDPVYDELIAARDLAEAIASERAGDAK